MNTSKLSICHSNGVKYSVLAIVSTSYACIFVKRTRFEINLGELIYIFQLCAIHQTGCNIQTCPMLVLNVFLMVMPMQPNVSWCAHKTWAVMEQFTMMPMDNAFCLLIHQPRVPLIVMPASTTLAEFVPHKPPVSIVAFYLMMFVLNC